MDTVIRRIQNQVLAHDGQANEAEISSGYIVSLLSFDRVRESARRPADINAGKAHTEGWGAVIRKGSFWKLKLTILLKLLQRKNQDGIALMAGLGLRGGLPARNDDSDGGVE